MTITSLLLCSCIFLISASAKEISLGTAASYGVLGASAVTNVGDTVIVGDLGVSSGSAISGFPPGRFTGEQHAADAPASVAQGDASTAYTAIKGQARTETLTDQDLGGKILVAGTYFYATSAQLTGQLILDGQNNPDSEFLFQIGTTLVTASASSIILINGAQACNVYWAVGSSATLGTTTVFLGSIIAQQSIDASNGASVDGGLYALVGAVTLINNAISRPICATIISSTSSTAVQTTSVQTTPGNDQTSTGPIPSDDQTTTGTTTGTATGTGQPPAGTTTDDDDFPGTIDQPRTTIITDGSTTITTTLPDLSTGDSTTIPITSTTPSLTLTSTTLPDTSTGDSTTLPITSTTPSLTLTSTTLPITSTTPSLSSTSLTTLTSPSSTLTSDSTTQSLTTLIDSTSLSSTISSTVSSTVSSQSTSLSNSTTTSGTRTVPLRSFSTSSSTSLSETSSSTSTLTSVSTTNLSVLSISLASLSTIATTTFPEQKTITTFVYECTTAPATITSYSQTFTITKTGKTTIVCPITPDVTITSFVYECTTAPATITSYSQTFTINKTGKTTIICPVTPAAPTATQVFEAHPSTCLCTDAISTAPAWFYTTSVTEYVTITIDSACTSTDQKLPTTTEEYLSVVQSTDNTFSSVLSTPTPDIIQFTGSSSALRSSSLVLMITFALVALFTCIC